MVNAGSESQRQPLLNKNKLVRVTETFESAITSSKNIRMHVRAWFLALIAAGWT